MNKDKGVVTKDVSQPLVPNKRCSKASFSVLSQIYEKMWKAIFTKFFLLLETKRLFHNLLVNGVQSADPRYSLTKRQNMRNYFSVCFSNNQVKVLIAQPFFV